MPGAGAVSVMAITRISPSRLIASANCCSALSRENPLCSRLRPASIRRAAQANHIDEAAGRPASRSSTAVCPRPRSAGCSALKSASEHHTGHRPAAVAARHAMTVSISASPGGTLSNRFIRTSRVTAGWRASFCHWRSVSKSRSNRPIASPALASRMQSFASRSMDGFCHKQGSLEPTAATSFRHRTTQTRLD